MDVPLPQIVSPEARHPESKAADSGLTVPETTDHSWVVPFDASKLPSMIQDESESGKGLALFGLSSIGGLGTLESKPIDENGLSLFPKRSVESNATEGSNDKTDSQNEFLTILLIVVGSYASLTTIYFCIRSFSDGRISWKAFPTSKRFSNREVARLYPGRK